MLKTVTRVIALAMAAALLFPLVDAQARQMIPPPNMCMQVGEGPHRRDLDPSLYYDPRHSCHSCQTQRANHCTGLNRVIAPNYNVEVDFPIIPHRGVWGFPRSRGIPENTLEAVQCAARQAVELNIIEIDVMRTSDGRAVLSHYFPMTWSEGTADESVPGLPLDQLTTRRVRMRNGELHPSITYSRFDDTVRWAWENGVVLVIDIKVRDGGSGPSGRAAFIETIRAMFNSLPPEQARQYLAAVIIKVPGYEVDAFMRDYQRLIQDYENYDGAFQWALIANKSKSTPENEVLTNIEAWVARHRNNLAFIETLMFGTGPERWETREIRRHSDTYYNLIDFVNRTRPPERGPGSPFRPQGLRASLWSLDSMGERGTFTREYKWRLFGNDPSDSRGIIPLTMSYRGVQRSMMTTDRFDVFRQYLEPVLIHEEISCANPQGDQ